MAKRNASGPDQNNKYAGNFSAGKKKKRTFTADNKQLKICADDFAKTLLDLMAANNELWDAYLDAIHRLVLAAEYKDEGTGDHTTRISRYSALIAEKIGLSRETVQNILYASPMHDVGKIGVPDSILLKPGKLNEKEFEIIKTHTTIGGDILADAGAGILQMAQLIAVTHHENWNGRGYPQGLAEEQIPLVGRIVRLADAFDALTSRRPYKEPYPIEVACDIIRQESGKLFDPVLVDIFITSINEIAKIKEEVGRPENTGIPDII